MSFYHPQNQIRFGFESGTKIIIMDPDPDWQRVMDPFGFRNTDLCRPHHWCLLRS
jgi:hypothetical protein